MEDLFLTVAEHKLLRKHKKSLEARYNVKLSMPEVEENNDNYSSDLIFASICGNKENIERVKNFLQRKKTEKITKCEESSSERTTIPVITVSDSDDDEDPNILIKTSNKENFKKRKKIEDEVLTVIDISSPLSVKEDMKRAISSKKASKRRKKEKFTVTNVDFIPLTNPNENKQKSLLNTRPESSVDQEVVDLDETPTPSSIPIGPRLLRPVVIDGSNVAREHGKTHNTFSCKGIKLCVEYFLKRGHTQVTAFVPHYRRHCTFGPISTTDQEILEELYRTQHVVYTPSRRVQGKRLTCYDDRFIVELASMTGGVILSNDNYKDLIGVSDDFKKTIEERLLMFCFVGDILMIPNDPLGRNGPCLDDFLSFPVEE